MNSTNKDIDLYIENNLYKYLPSIFDASNHQIKTSETIAVHEIKEIKLQIHANIKRYFLSNRDKKLRYGDIIGIPRKPLLNLVPYDHYGVYVNHDSVIHFSSKESDVSSLNNTIIETSLRIFTREDSGIFRLNFPDMYGKPTQIYVDETKLDFERSKYFIHNCVNNYFEKLKNIIYTCASSVQEVQQSESLCPERLVTTGTSTLELKPRGLVQAEVHYKDVGCI